MNEKRFSYHWLIVIACFLLTAVSIGILVNCFAVFVPELEKIFKQDVVDGVDPTKVKVQYIFTIAALANLVGSALVGKIMGKFTMRLAMPVYATIMSAGIFMWSNATTLQMFYIASAFVGLGASGIAVIPCGALINNWFEGKKGLATGIAFTGSGAGGLLLVQLSTYVIANYSLSTAYLVLAIVAAVISIPITIFVVREHPRDKGLLPYGASTQGGGAQAELKGITLGKFIKTGSFWMLAITVFIISFINVGLQNHIPTHMEGSGISRETAANIFSLYLLLLIPGKILLGYIYDKMGIDNDFVECYTSY
jgi:MFS family permease